MNCDRVAPGVIRRPLNDFLNFHGGSRNQTGFFTFCITNILTCVFNQYYNGAIMAYKITSLNVYKVANSMLLGCLS